VTKPFQLVAGHPVLDLINTLDWRFRETGPEELLNTYDDLLQFSEQSMLLTARQAQRLRKVPPPTATKIMQSTRDLREATSQILYAIMDARTPPIDAIKKLDQHIQKAQANRTLRWSQSRFELSWPNTEADAQLPLWLLTQSAADFLTGERMQRLRSCDSPECRWLFLDTSKNHTRRWCDMKLCGNRMKARRFKAQHSA
jgi:predicted RNA-binding Zn ribbon-like protein